MSKVANASMSDVGGYWNPGTYLFLLANCYENWLSHIMVIMLFVKTGLISKEK